MKIYCHNYRSMSEALQRYAGKDLWLRVVVHCNVPNPHNGSDVEYEPLPSGPYYIQILSVNGDTCQAHLWDEEYFDIGAEWAVPTEYVLNEVYTVPTNKIVYYINSPEVYSTEELLEQFERNKRGE